MTAVSRYGQAFIRQPPAGNFQIHSSRGRNAGAILIYRTNLFTVTRRSKLRSAVRAELRQIRGILKFVPAVRAECSRYRFRPLGAAVLAEVSGIVLAACTCPSAGLRFLDLLSLRRHGLLLCSALHELIDLRSHSDGSAHSHRRKCVDSAVRIRSCCLHRLCIADAHISVLPMPI